MTENEIKEFVAEIRQKSEIFRNSGFATTGITNVFDKSADIIEELLPYMAIGTVDEFKALKEKSVAKKPYHISEIDDNDNAMVECPICHANNDYSINTIKSGYCWKCGHKLDWQ